MSFEDKNDYMDRYKQYLLEHNDETNGEDYTIDLDCTLEEYKEKEDVMSMEELFPNMEDVKDYANGALESTEVFHLIDESGNKVIMSYEELDEYNKRVCEGSTPKHLSLP